MHDDHPRPRSAGRLKYRVSQRVIVTAAKRTEPMRHQNRNARRAPKGGKFWCCGCDMVFVPNDRKCPVCGVRNNKGKRREKAGAR